MDYNSLKKIVLKETEHLRKKINLLAENEQQTVSGKPKNVQSGNTLALSKTVPNDQISDENVASKITNQKDYFMGILRAFNELRVDLPSVFVATLPDADENTKNMLKQRLDLALEEKLHALIADLEKKYPGISANYSA